MKESNSYLLLLDIKSVDSVDTGVITLVKECKVCWCGLEPLVLGQEPLAHGDGEFLHVVHLFAAAQLAQQDFEGVVEVAQGQVVADCRPVVAGVDVHQHRL